ncbi:MAG: glycosyltransferase family 4 protein [Chloroflexi bacterium]|nr:glycosyltransferase family 4 protein [Chloroflexota bacterium]
MSSKKETSICQVMGYYNSGGIARVVTDLALRLQDHFNVTVVCRKALTKPDKGLNVIELNPKNTIDLWLKLRGIGKFDIVHCHDVYALPSLVRAAAPVIYTDHAIVPWKYLRFGDRSGFCLAYLCSRYALPRVDLAVAISDYTLDELRNRYRCTRVVKIPDGVDTALFCPAPPRGAATQLKGSPVLLYVGLMEKHKGTRFLVRAMSRVLDELPEALLVLVGGGRDEERLRRLSKGMAGGKRVVFTGRVDDRALVSYYNASDIHVEASYWHGFGLPIVEAMACGKPVIARDAYAMREHIVNSQAGVMFKRDDPAELVRCIQQVMENYDTYASRARKYAEGFSLDRIAARYVTAFQTTLGRSRG